jgi:hypothetical protein
VVVAAEAGNCKQAADIERSFVEVAWDIASNSSSQIEITLVANDTNNIRAAIKYSYSNKYTFAAVVGFENIEI